MSVIQSARLGANRRASRTCKRSLSGTRIGPGLLLRIAFEKPESASVALTATAESCLCITAIYVIGIELTGHCQY